MSAVQDDIDHPNIDALSLDAWQESGAKKKQEMVNDMLRDLAAAKRQITDGIERLEENIGSSEADDPMIVSWRREINRLHKQLHRLTEEQEKLAAAKGLNHIFDSVVSEEFSRTLFNHDLPLIEEVDDVTETEEANLRFVGENEGKIRDFGWLSKLEDIHTALSTTPKLVSEEVVTFLTSVCIGLVMENKKHAMKYVAKQTVLLTKILHLMDKSACSPRMCINAVMQRLKTAKLKEDKRSSKASAATPCPPSQSSRLMAAAIKFAEGLDNDTKEFANNIISRAEKERDQLKQKEVHNIAEMLGDNQGPSPIKVLESLPKCLRRCFEQRDATKLRQVIARMPLNDAQKYMKKCVQAGLWKPSMDDGETCQETGLLMTGEMRQMSQPPPQKRLTEYPQTIEG